MERRLKNIYYRVPHSYDELDYQSLCGIAKSQLQRLSLETDYTYIELNDHSFMLEEGSDLIYFVVKHKLSSSTDSILCYSIFGGEDEILEVPKFFSSVGSHDAISIYEVEKLGGLGELNQMMNQADSFNYQIFL